MVVEVTYGFRNVGAGASTADAGEVLTIGNTNGLNVSYQGDIGLFMMHNKRMTLGELRQQQFRTHPVSGTVVFNILGYNGTGTQPDLSGNFNSGAVTGASQTEHVPVRMA